MDKTFVIKGNICQTKTPNELDLHEKEFVVCVNYLIVASSKDTADQQNNTNKGNQFLHWFGSPLFIGFIFSFGASERSSVTSVFNTSGTV